MGHPESSAESASASPGPCFWHGARRATAACHGCGRRVCAECAVAVTVDDPPKAADACPPCAPLFGVESSVPFENPGGFGSFWRTWWWALVRPQRLFAALPRQGAGRATAFAYLTWLPAALLTATCFGLLVMALSGMGHSGGGDAGPAIVVTVSIVFGALALAPLIVLAFALPLHVVVLLARGEGGFATTYRMLCYQAGLVAVGAPVVMVGGSILGSMVPCGFFVVWAPAEVWHAWALFHAVRRVHGLRPGAAVATALVPLGVRGVMLGALVGAFVLAFW